MKIVDGDTDFRATCCGHIIEFVALNPGALLSCCTTDRANGKLCANTMNIIWIDAAVASRTYSVCESGHNIWKHWPNRHTGIWLKSTNTQWQRRQTKHNSHISGGLVCASNCSICFRRQPSSVAVFKCFDSVEVNIVFYLCACNIIWRA